jgi:AraC-like DNA-binding protein
MDVLTNGRALTDSPQSLLDRPEWKLPVDPLTEVFMSMRVESVVYGRLELSAPWGFSHPETGLAKFAMVLRGSCWLNVEGADTAIPLTGGDCFLLPRGNAYTLRDHPHSHVRDFAEILALRRGDGIQYGGGGAPTTLIGGKFIFDLPCSKPLMDLLPPVIHIRGDETRTLALQTTLQLLAAEIASPGPGSQVIVSRFADTLFVQAIRAHMTSPCCSKTGWLRALADPAMGVAIQAMHENLREPWTVATLASEAGMSRSAFALRFKELVGEAPLEYLTRWRMYQAGRLLREGKKKLVEVANLVGYDSDAAFNKAFKRVLGVTPGEYRRNGD